MTKKLTTYDSLEELLQAKRAGQLGDWIMHVDNDVTEVFMCCDEEDERYAPDMYTVFSGDPKAVLIEALSLLGFNAEPV